MTRARWSGKEFEIVNFTEDAEWVLRDDEGDVTVQADDPGGPGGKVLIQCDRCARWTEFISQVRPDRWVCADAPCYEAERNLWGG